jgi:hypothetical protein
MELPFINGTRPTIYGDSAYAGSPVLQRPTQDSVLNTRMGSHRIIVEQSFGKLKTLCAFLSFPTSVKILKINIRVYFKVAAILTNAHTCATGISSAGATGGVAPPSIFEYFSVTSLVCAFRNMIDFDCVCFMSLQGGSANA